MTAQDVIERIEKPKQAESGFIPQEKSKNESVKTTDDLISRQAAIEIVDRYNKSHMILQGKPMLGAASIVIELEALSSAQPEQRWIPFNTRSLTEEEKEDHPEWDCILDCKLPDDGQAILVSINVRGHERVQYDVFFTDDGSYLDSGYEIGTEATAWMPLPEPYSDTISRQAALDAIDKNRQDLLFLGMDGAEHILAYYGRRVIEELPTADPVKNKLQRAIDGKTEEEIYDFLNWLMFKYAKQYTDSRSAVIQWLREDDTERRTDEQ